MVNKMPNNRIKSAHFRQRNMQTFSYPHPLRCKYQTSNMTNISAPNPPPRTVQMIPECTNAALTHTTMTKIMMTKNIVTK